MLGGGNMLHCDTLQYREREKQGEGESSIPWAMRTQAEIRAGAIFVR